MKLTVAEARRQADVGRGLVRLDEGVMRKLGVGEGDVVEVIGSKLTGAIALKGYPEDRGLQIVRIDGFIRRNAGTSIGEKVTLRKAEVKEAKKVTIAPAEVGVRFIASGEVIKRNLLGRPLVKGDLITTSAPLGADIFEEFFGGFVGLGEMKFIVTATSPLGIVLVTELTSVEVLPEAVEVKEVKVPAVTYEDIGGLKEELQRVREMIELPLRHPELFDRLGIEPPKGILLHGPPGTGKTLIAKAVANEADAYFIPIAGPEIMCVEPDVRVLTDGYGVLTVGELFNMGKRIGDGLVEHDVGILALKGSKCSMSKLRAMRLFRGAGYKLKVKNGVSQDDIEVSAHQRFLVFDGKDLSWKPVEEVKLGDWIAAPKTWDFVGHDVRINWIWEHPEPSTLYVKFNGKLSEVLGPKVTLQDLREYLKAHENVALDEESLLVRSKHSFERDAWVKLPQRLTPELAYLIGLMLTDAHLSEVEVSFHAQDEKLRKKFKELFAQVFGINDINNCSKVLAWYLNKYFEIPFGAKAKVWRIPPIIAFAGLDIVRAFIAGVYDGDSFYSKSRDALIGLQFLLLRLGISKTCVKRHNTPFGQLYKLVISRAEQPKLAAEIGRYSIKYVPARGLTDHTRFPFSDAFREILREHRLSYGVFQDENAEPRINGRLPLSDSIATKYYQILSEVVTTANPLNKVSFPLEFRWLKVVEKEPINGEFYDLQIEDDTFIGCKSTPVLYHNSKFYGESEARLREVFQDAEKNAPAIVFIDELDAIAPKREEVTGEVERRVVAQLLSLMDGLKARGKVVVIGATNRPQALDPALRRPGRFDREIVIGVPDRDGRKEILQIHTRGMPLAKDVDLDALANVTHGFVGADLEAICKEAAMSALRRILPEIKLEEKVIPPEVLEKLQVTKEDFDNALKMVEPSAMREVLIEVPDVRWEDIGGLEGAKQELREAVEWPLKHPDSFKRMGIEPPRGILLYGPPGTGKTLLARAVATESEANFIAIKGPELLSKWVGESERGVRETFRKAKMAAPAIVFFDEIDALVPRRGSGIGDAHVTERVISQLLTELDGLEKLENVVVIAATNRPDLIDPALLRPGRFDRLVLVPAPDKKARLEIFKIHTKGMPLAKDVDLEALATETEGYAGSDIAALCREAAILVLRKDMKAKEVRMGHFREAMKKVRPTITPDIAKGYEAFGERYGKRLAEEVTLMHY